MNMHAADPFLTLWAMGYRHLVPIIPPGAPLSERSNLFKRLAAGRDARGKTPGVRWPDGTWSGYDWLAGDGDETDLRRWSGMGAGVGVKTGVDGVVVVDADTLDVGLADVIRAAVERRFGPLPTRIGQSPKALFVLRAAGACAYQRIEFDGAGGARERVEILSSGKQFVAHGVHPLTMRPYTWTTRLVPLGQLPTFPAEEIAAFMAELRALLPACSPVVVEGAGAETQVNQEALRGDPAIVRRAVLATPNSTAAFPTRERYRDFGYAIKAAMGPEREAEGLELFQGWCARWTGGHNDPEVVEADWRRMKPPFRRGAGWLYRTAEEYSGGAFSAAGQWFEPIEDEPESIFRSDELEPSKTFARIDATPYEFPDPASIPRRDSIYGGHYIRQFVSTTVAPSKVGKSSLGIAEALAMASGKPLLGVQPKGLSRVWLWNGEDPIEELERRVAACMMLHGLTREDVGDRLFLDTGRRMPIVLAEQSRGGALVAAPVARDVLRALAAHRIDVMAVDPFISSHRVSENDNNAIDLVAKTWAGIADEARIALELVHHVRKLNGGEVTVEDGRGAVALLAASRSARALARMTKTEATRLGLLGVYRRLFRFADTSSNLALPADGEAERWYELASISLGNGEGAEAVDRLISGDSVGVVRVFDMPREAERIAETVRREMGDGASALSYESACLDLLRSGDWRADLRAGDAWAGAAICRSFGLDRDDPEARGQAKRILSLWLKSGKVREVSRQDHRRHLKTFIEVVAPDTSKQGDKLSDGGLFD